jgi:hypothetical protein
MASAVVDSATVVPAFVGSASPHAAAVITRPRSSATVVVTGLRTSAAVIVAGFGSTVTMVIADVVACAVISTVTA